MTTNLSPRQRQIVTVVTRTIERPVLDMQQVVMEVRRISKGLDLPLNSDERRAVVNEVATRFGVL